MRTSLRETLRDSAYVGPRTSRVIAGLLLLAGAVAAVGGVGYAIAGATNAPGGVAVPISLEVDDGASGVVVPGPVQVRVDGVDLPDGARLQAPDDGLELVASPGQASRWTGFLARGDAALLGLGFGACALLLVPVVNAVAAGEPFRRGNAARIGGTAAIVGVVGMVAPALPQIAAIMLLDGLDLVGAENPFVVGFGFNLAPVGLAALIFVIAEAFRRGTQITADAAGLV